MILLDQILQDGLSTDSERGRGIDGAWNWRGPGGVAGRNVSDAQLAVWSAIVGRAHSCRDGGHSGGCRTRGQLSSCAPRGSRESNGGVAGGVIRRGSGALSSVFFRFTTPFFTSRSTATLIDPGVTRTFGPIVVTGGCLLLGSAVSSRNSMAPSA